MSGVETPRLAPLDGALGVARIAESPATGSGAGPNRRLRLCLKSQDHPHGPPPIDADGISDTQTEPDDGKDAEVRTAGSARRKGGLVAPLVRIPELTHSTAKFVSIANSVAGLRDYATQCAGQVSTSPYEASVILRSVQPRSRRPLPTDAGRYLRIAWQTELAARVGDALDDQVLRRVAAQTLPVQAYYAVFNAARAFTLVAGAPASTHTSVHKDFATQRAGRAAGPWAVSLRGNPDQLESCTLSPQIGLVSSFNTMERSHAPEDYVAASLRMTRRWKVELERNEWLKKNKKKDGTPYTKLPSGKPAELAIGLRPTTVMDFLYELRRRTNYETTDEYGSDASDDDVARFHDGLLYLAHSGLLIYEVMIARYVGLENLREVSNDWQQSVRRVGPWAAASLTERIDAIAAEI